MSDGSHNEVPADWVVTNSNHWVYANTGMSDGARIPGIVFNEWDGVVNNGLNPPGLVTLASRLSRMIKFLGADTRRPSMSEETHSSLPREPFFMTRIFATTGPLRK